MERIHIDKASARYAIINMAETAAEAESVVQYLASLDWQQIYLERKQQAQQREQEKQHQSQEIIKNGGGYCDECEKIARDLFSIPSQYSYLGMTYMGKYCFSCTRDIEKWCKAPTMERRHQCGRGGCYQILPYKELVRDERIEARGYGYCPSCLAQLIEEKTITCVECGKRTLDYTYISHYQSLCKSCYVKPPAIQAVISNNFRAQSLGLSATLTDVQWENTLAYFNNMCAYCNVEPYQVLEHFMPISKRGGTTIDNCIPSCFKCNSKKHGKHPDDFVALFPTDNIARIKAYFASLAEHL